MEITAWDLYWITRLDPLRNCSTIGLGLIGVLAFSMVVMGPLLLDEDFGFRRHLRPWMAWVIAALLALCTAIHALVPTTKEMCAILVIPAVANNEDVQALGGDIVDLAREWVEELKPEGGE